MEHVPDDGAAAERRAGLGRDGAAADTLESIDHDEVGGARRVIERDEVERVEGRSGRTRRHDIRVLKPDRVERARTEVRGDVDRVHLGAGLEHERRGVGKPPELGMDLCHLRHLTQHGGRLRLGEVNDFWCRRRRFGIAARDERVCCE